jgi:hypothetical protein
MVSEPADIGDALLADRLEDFRESWVVATAKHKILPHQNPELVA